MSSKRVGVFAKKTEADEQTGTRPEPERARTSLEGQPEGEHRRRPKKDRERIDRHDQVADVEERDGVERDDRPEAGLLAEEFSREIIEEQAGRRAEDRTPEADPEFGVAEKRGAGANRKRDPGPFAEIGGRQAVGPHPVMRLVEGKVGGAEQGKPDRRETEDEEPNRARVTHELFDQTRMTGKELRAPSGGRRFSITIRAAPS